MHELIDIGSNTKLECNDNGHGPAVVLIHGWPVTSFHWRFIRPDLHDAGYRTIEVTLRGLGGQSEGGGNLEKLTLAQEVQLLLEKMEVNKYSVIGHDWGGTVAYLLTHIDKAKCFSLIIEEEILPGIEINIPLPGKNYYPEWHGPLNRAVGLAEELIQGRENGYYLRFLTESAGMTGLDESAMAEYISAYTMRQKVNSQLKDSLGLYRTKLNDIKEISLRMTTPLRVPILAVGGEYAMGTAVKEGLNKAGIKVCGIVSSGAGHYPIEQNIESCHEVILDFINKSIDYEIA